MVVDRPRGIWKDGAPLVDNGWITNRTGEAERRGEVGRFGETTRGGRRMTVCLVPGSPFYSFFFFFCGCCSCRVSFRRSLCIRAMFV